MLLLLVGELSEIPITEIGLEIEIRFAFTRYDFL